MSKQKIADRADLIKYIEQCGSDDLPAFGGTYVGNYCLEQAPEELAEYLLFLKDAKIENYLEIGIAAAGVVRIMIDFFDIQNVSVIDLPYNKVLKERKENLDYIATQANLHIYNGNSTSSEASDFLKDINIKYDLILIDGGHDYATVKSDLQMALQYINDGGMIAFHDVVSMPDVTRVYNECLELSCLEFQILIDADKKGLGIFKYVAN